VCVFETNPISQLSQQQKNPTQKNGRDVCPLPISLIFPLDIEKMVVFLNSKLNQSFTFRYENLASAAVHSLLLRVLFDLTTPHTLTHNFLLLIKKDLRLEVHTSQELFTCLFSIAVLICQFYKT
jgi:hypothetical protein